MNCWDGVVRQYYFELVTGIVKFAGRAAQTSPESAAHRDYWLTDSRPKEWLLIEWLDGEKEPIKYWLSMSTLPQDVAFRQLVGIAKLRWRSSRRSGWDILKDGDGAASTITLPFALRPTDS